MTTEQLKNLVAYLKYMANSKATTPDIPASPGEDSGGLSSLLANAGIKQGIKSGIKYGWQEYGKPAWNSLFSDTTSGGGGAVADATGPSLGSSAYEASPYYTGAAEGVAGASEGVGANAGSSLASYAPYLSILAPALMMYSHWTGGSGVNEPKRKQAETMGSGRMLTDMLAGKQIDPNDSYAQYSLPVKNLIGNQENYPVADPKGYTPYELYTRMHDYSSSSGHPQTGGLGDSGMTDEQIDSMFGGQSKLSSLLGVERLPDWEKLRQTGQADPSWDIWSKGNPQLVSNKKWMELTPAEQAKYGYDQARWQQELNQPLNQTTNY